MKLSKSLRWMTLAATLSLPIACASQLDRELTQNNPRALAAAVDLSLVNFVDVESGASLNVATYMQETGKDYLLLTFGSENCPSCNQKAAKLQDEVIGQHPLFLTDAGQRLEIIGVNTDPVVHAGMDQYFADFPFIRWSDPRGVNMLTYFMPEGYTFSVPLTVLVVKDGIAWRIPPDESVSVEDIMARTKAYLTGESAGDDGAGDDAVDEGGDEGGDEDGDEGGDDDGTDIEEPDPTDLATVAPGRLKQISVTDCAGTNHKLDDILSAQEFGAVDMRFVQVARPSCGADCQHNASVLKDVAAQCAAGATAVSGKSCSTTTLIVGDLTAADCARGNVYSGGEDFFSVFNTHFYRETVGDSWDPILPELEGPLTFAFAGSGLLAFSHDGKLDQSAAILATWLASANENTVATGPDFPLFSADEGEFSFSEVRASQELTVLTVFDGDFVCSGCIKELRHWSQPGELVDICAETGRCQMLAMEYNQPHGSTPAELRRWLDDLHNAPDPFGQPGHLLDGIRVPVVLDPVSLNDHPAARFHQGFLAAWSGDTVSKTVIFNREGRIVYVNNPLNVGSDEITPVVKQLLGID